MLYRLLLPFAYILACCTVSLVAGWCLWSPEFSSLDDPTAGAVKPLAFVVLFGLMLLSAGAVLGAAFPGLLVAIGYAIVGPNAKSSVVVLGLVYGLAAGVLLVDAANWTAGPSVAKLNCLIPTQWGMAMAVLVGIGLAMAHFVLTKSSDNGAPGPESHKAAAG